jgi:hypothetical protein
LSFRHGTETTLIAAFYRDSSARSDRSPEPGFPPGDPGASIADIAPSIGALLGFAAVFAGVGLWRFRFER